MANLNIAGVYTRIGDYFYFDGSNSQLLKQSFKLGLCTRLNIRPNQPPTYLMMFPHNAVKLPDGRPNKYISGLYKLSEGVYRIEWEGTYYKCTISSTTAIIDLWGAISTTGGASNGR